MEISEELQDFLNDNNILDLIAAQDWRELFSKVKVNLAKNIQTLHEILVNSNLTSTDEILLSLGYVPGRFFSGFDNLTSIKLPPNITSIGDYAFFDCNSLTSITIPNSVTSIGDYAFYNCTKLTDITLPTSLTSIGYGAFLNCVSLTSITIPDKVTSIDYYTFFGCSSLTSITIPGSVTRIGKGAFGGCRELETIVFKGTEEQWDQIGNEISWRDCKNEVKIIFK